VPTSRRIDPATAGRWRLSAQTVTTGGTIYTPTPAAYDQSVAPGDTVPLPVRYAVSSGALSVVVAGLPNGVDAAVTVTGPGSYTRSITSTTTLTTLEPGSYTIRSAPVSAAGNGYTASAAVQTVEVSASLVAAPATVTYSLSTGSLAVAVTGLPGGTNGAVTVSGPGGYSRALTATATLPGLVPGSYTVAAATVVVTGNDWLPSPPTQTVTVSASAVAAPATVAYALGTGSLAVTVTGVPGGASGAVTVTGPGSYSRSISATTTLSALVPGTYTIAAAAITSGGQSFTAATASQNVTVNATSTAATGTRTIDWLRPARRHSSTARSLRQKSFAMRFSAGGFTLNASPEM
jgi:hypothetical protein